MVDPAIRLGQLVAEATPHARRSGDIDVVITDITHDSRAVSPGTLFCCIPGERHDGHGFAQEAVASGAVALLVQRPLPGLGVAQIEVEDVRASIGPLASALWGHPSALLDVVGVTGTNGKTTVTHLLRSVLVAAGRPTEILGTLSGVRTTPEASDLQRQLARWLSEGCSAVAMEVSSHALALHRVDGTHFAAAVFTNLSRDHLDFHRTMSAYFQAKARLFSPEFAKLGVVNLDDPHGRLLRDAAEIPTVGFSMANALNITYRAEATTFLWRGSPVRLQLAGAHNLANALAAATVAVELGVDEQAIIAGLEAVQSVPGRFESIELGQPFGVVVDYAHTPDALERVLEASRVIAAGRAGRVLIVFGCGGDRDTTKRTAMGEVAARLADLVFITSDNPRSEDPVAIIEAIQAGIRIAAPLRATDVVLEPDRYQAIKLAIQAARIGDVVIDRKSVV